MKRNTHLLLVLALVALGAVLLLVGGCGGDSSENKTPSPFAGNYSGTFAGTQSGTWTGTVSNSGHVVMTALINARSFTGTGQLSSAGTTTVSGSASGTGFSSTWMGTYVIGVSNITCSGTWQDNKGDSGTWTGSN